MVIENLIYFYEYFIFEWFIINFKDAGRFVVVDFINRFLWEEMVCF